MVEKLLVPRWILYSSSCVIALAVVAGSMAVRPSYYVMSDESLKAVSGGACYANVTKPCSNVNAKVCGCNNCGCNVACGLVCTLHGQNETWGNAAGYSVAVTYTQWIGGCGGGQPAPLFGDSATKGVCGTCCAYKATCQCGCISGINSNQCCGLGASTCTCSPNSTTGCSNPPNFVCTFHGS